MSEPEDDINNNPQVHPKNNRRIDTRRVENRLIQLESRLEKAREARVNDSKLRRQKIYTSMI